MKCPNCHSLMKCISAINPIPGQPGRDRMDLHCTFDAGFNKRGCYVRCHMGVITEDPKEWECHEYGFGFFIKINIICYPVMIRWWILFTKADFRRHIHI